MVEGATSSFGKKRSSARSTDFCRVARYAFKVIARIWKTAGSCAMSFHSGVDHFCRFHPHGQKRADQQNRSTEELGTGAGAFARARRRVLEWRRNTERAPW